MPNAVAGLGLLGVGVMLIVAVGTLAYSYFSQEPQQNQYEYHNWRRRASDSPPFDEGYDAPQINNRRRRRSRSEANDMCPICKEGLCDSVSLRCNHNFHRKCISEWFQLSSSSEWGTSTCPVCRSRFSAQDVM